MRTVKVISLLLLPLLMLNGAKSDCNYELVLESGQTYYAYSANYPNYYYGEQHCIWRIKSRYATKVNCIVEMPYNSCSFAVLSIGFDNGYKNYCGSGKFILTGFNPVIKYDFSYNSNSKFLCEIQAEQSQDGRCYCGWENPTRIVGGKETGVNQYPMMAGLVDIKNKIIKCGATIISDRYVVTAAHCISGKVSNDIAIVVGEHDVTTGTDTNATKLYSVLYCVKHPGFDDAHSYRNDIAVCKVTESIRFSAAVGPVCLPFRYTQSSFVNEIVTALGWGLLEFGGQKATTLQEADLNVIPSNMCSGDYPDLTLGNMCTYTPGKDSCQMDSGGPVLWRDPRTRNLILAGIISSGIGCAFSKPGIETRVGAYTDWILNVTSDAFYCVM